MEMREGNLWKNILIYSLPLMFSNLLQVFFNMADVAVVGKFAGSIAMGGVGSTSLLVVLTTGFLIGMSNGVNALTALFIGAGEKKNEKAAVHTGFLLSAAIGIIVLSAGLILSRPVLTLLGTKDELMAEALSYFRIYMLGSPALALYNFGNAVLSAAGDTRKPLRFLTIAGILNVVLNLVFVIGFGMTASGVALASIIAQYLSAVLILQDLLRTKEDYRLSPADLHFDGTIAARILRISVPAAVQYSLFSIANLFVQSAVNSFDHVVVEGNSAAMNLDAFVYDTMAAFYTACTSFVAQNFGAGKPNRVKKTYAITTIYSFGWSLALGLLIYAFRTPILYLFTNDADVVAMGTIRLAIMSLSYCVSAFMDNATAACRGLGRTAVPTVFIILGTVVFRIVWIYTVFAYFGTMQSLYLLYVCAWVLTAAAENIYLYAISGKMLMPHMKT